MVPSMTNGVKEMIKKLKMFEKHNFLLLVCTVRGEKVFFVFVFRSSQEDWPHHTQSGYIFTTLCTVHQYL